MICSTTAGPPPHVPVLLGRVMEAMNVRPDGKYVDCTLGAGGYSEAVLAVLVTGRLLAIDRDEEALRLARARLGTLGRAEFVRGNFADLEALCAANHFAGSDGVMYDLGVSSMQLEEADRGFSFRSEGPLDMRMDRSEGRTALDLLKETDEREFSRALFRFGEKKYARKLARAICHDAAAGRLETTADLAGLVRRVRREPHGRTDSATRTFLAIRCLLNGELEALTGSLKQAARILKPGGRLAVVTYHSLEDRIVKEAFARGVRGCRCELPADLCLCSGPAYYRAISKKPILPSREEMEQNRRARSAKLRVVERTGTP